MITKLPYPMGIYKDEDQKTYRVLMLARHRDKGIEYVVFQALDGERQPNFLLELEDFQAKMVDVESVIKAAPSGNFPINAKKEPETIEAKADDAGGGGDSSYALDSAVSEFLESDDFDQRLNILAMLKHRVTDDMINTMAIAIDVVIEDGYIEDRFDALKKSLLIRKKYEHKRVV